MSVHVKFRCREQPARLRLRDLVRQVEDLLNKEGWRKIFPHSHPCKRTDLGHPLTHTSASTEQGYGADYEDINETFIVNGATFMGSDVGLAKTAEEMLKNEKVILATRLQNALRICGNLLLKA
eukprot:Protomagalhaensia_sp_Gyna_25__2590@NODE_2473_length_1066_cov_3_876339_g2048_i0_p2_GENE_NODE_2473_length_1066_cov_3_876339_g2048_i0NODE_2473_length_1066_cov_3_876339_g2048_i0_p2_ORF_typecomplete_len123_score11_58_NODE_2473_length_1066_cov_3_876339_g2048_i0541909